MILKNPTDQELSITRHGTEYVLPAKGSLGSETPDDVKAYWKNNIHEFLILEDGGKVVEKIDEPKPRIVEPEVAIAAVEDSAEEEVAEVVAPVAKKVAVKKTAK